MVVSALDVDNPKPAPDMLVKILEHYTIAPQQAIYVGDSQLDEEAACAAGVPLIAYNNPGLSAEYHIDRLIQVKEILNSSSLNHQE